MATSQAISAAAGRAHSCAVFVDPDGPDRVVRCWGDNSVGQLGNGTTAPTDFDVELVAKQAELPAGFVPERVSARGDVTCVVSAGDAQQVLCWGAGQYGALGQGSPQNIGDEPGELEGVSPVSLAW